MTDSCPRCQGPGPASVALRIGAIDMKVCRPCGLEIVGSPGPQTRLRQRVMLTETVHRDLHDGDSMLITMSDGKSLVGSLSLSPEAVGLLAVGHTATGTLRLFASRKEEETEATPGRVPGHSL